MMLAKTEVEYRLVRTPRLLKTASSVGWKMDRRDGNLKMGNNKKQLYVTCFSGLKQFLRNL